MGYEQILYDVADAVATITLNRPEKLNAWTMRLGAEVRHAMVRADRDPAVRAIVVTGAGKGYCAGADMDMLQGLGRGSGLDAIPEDLHGARDRSPLLGPARERGGSGCNGAREPRRRARGAPLPRPCVRDRDRDAVLSPLASHHEATAPDERVPRSRRRHPRRGWQDGRLL